MKKLLFALGLLLSGVIGFAGWTIAVVCNCQPGANSVVFGCFRGAEWVVLVFFAALAVVGLVLAIRELLRDK